MAKDPWKITEGLELQVGALVEAIRGEAQDLRAEFDERSDRWHETDRADEVETWLDALDEMADSLENLASDVDSM